MIYNFANYTLDRKDSPWIGVLDRLLYHGAIMINACSLHVKPKRKYISRLMLSYMATRTGFLPVRELLSNLRAGK